SFRHSLCYSCRKVSEPSQRLPLFLSLVHLDDQPIARNGGLTSMVVPLVPWMEVEEAKIFVGLERRFRTRLEWLSKFSHQIGGLHTWQVIWGCELREDGRKGGFLRYGYDGMDFISFDKETLRWVAAQPQAKKVKEEWEDHPRWSQRNKVFLEETCIDMMQKCLSFQKESPKKTEPLVGKVTRKMVDDSLEVLICQAFGFYPKEIQATWRKDGKVYKDKILHRNVAPNSDGTFYVWLSIEIDPKERDRFWCHLEHEGLQGPLVLALKEET
ncbi:major histocompatibility complex class I-related gene protein-like, partial [Protobothrops mucrosquamatus]|uniref:major histocompatibility complex class I-related gene protein-like n=1 Tax=Protobothrops mucrosquamatus TaxID=103944 RepID=UPI000775AF6A